jgi:hypothetical protein
MNNSYVRVTSQENFIKFGDVKSNVREFNIDVFYLIGGSVNKIYTGLDVINSNFNSILIKLNSEISDMFIKNTMTYMKTTTSTLSILTAKIDRIETYNFHYSMNKENNKINIKKKINELLKIMGAFNTSGKSLKGIQDQIRVYKRYFNIIYDKLKQDYATFVIKCTDVRYNFNSFKKKECNLFTYHNIENGAGCQFIGFLGTNMDSTVFKSFIDNVKAHSQIPMFVIYTGLIDNHITSSDDYKKTYSKDLHNKFMSLNYAETEGMQIATDSTQIKELVQGSPLRDEYVLISNDDINIMTIIIKNYENTTIDLSEIMLDYLKKLNNERTTYFDTTFKLLDNLVVMEEARYEKKYLKYKTKYLQLKFEQTKFFK